MAWLCRPPAASRGEKGDRCRGGLHLRGGARDPGQATVAIAIIDLGPDRGAGLQPDALDVDAPRPDDAAEGAYPKL